MGDESDKEPRRGRTRMNPTERRDKILAAAADMFQRHGYAGASIDAIAAASGISGPGIYRYFGGKTELLLALLDTAAVQATAAIDAAILLDKGPEAVRRIADVLVDHVLIEGPIIALLQGTIVDMDAAGRTRLECLRDNVVARLVSALKNARPALGQAEAEGRIVAAIAVVGQARRILSTESGPDVFRQIIGAIFDA